MNTALLAAEKNLNSTGLTRDVSGSGCTDLNDCIEEIQSIHHELSQEYSAQGKQFTLVAFDNKTRLVNSDSQLKWPELQSTLNDGEFIYGITNLREYSSSIYNYLTSLQ